MDFSLELGKEVLRRTPDVLQAMLSDRSDAWVAASEAPDVWSPCQVVGHLTYKTLEALAEAGDLGRRGVHPHFGEVTISQLLATWVVHDLNHLGQFVKTMAKQYVDAVGPWREFLPIIDAP